MSKKKCFGWLGALFFLIILLMPVNVYAKGTIRSLSVSGWNSAKNSQELMFERFLENRLSSYSNNKKNMHAYSYNVENGGISISTMNRLFSNAYTGSTKDDLLFFYYSGHSTVDENKQFFGISLHGSKDGVDVTYQYKEMAEQLAKYKGTIVIIMDTCGAENFYTKGVAQLSSSSDRKRFHCLLSCGNEEESKFSANNIAMVPLTVFKGIKYGSFTYAIGKGLGFWNGSIKADSNANGTVTIGELYSYATANTKPFFHKMTVKLYSANKNLSIFSYPVTISSTSIKLKVSEKSTLTAKVGGVKVKPKWKSSNTSVATVSSNGVITAKKVGAANISATINGTTSTCKVTVYTPASITLNKTKVSINKGDILQLKATVKGASKTVTWKSSNPSVASVDRSGKITAKKAGSVTITASANAVTAKCIITVKKTYKITLSKTSLTMLQGKSYTLKATITGPSKNVAWKSSNNSIATVSSIGKVTAKKKGTAYITATANGVVAKCTIIVKDVSYNVCGTWEVDSDLTMKNNGVSMFYLFGTGYKYGSKMTLDKNGAFSYGVGIGYGGLGSYSYKNNMITYSVKQYEDGAISKGTMSVSKLSGKVYIIQNLKDLYHDNCTYKLYWKYKGAIN